jgi:MFS family permease
MMGITALSIGLGTSIMAPAANAILQGMGWQAAFLFLGTAFLVFVFLPSIIFIKGKGRPEDRGFGPDGIPLDVMNGSGQALASPAVDVEKDWTVESALRTGAFWGIFIAMGLSYMADYIILFHSVAYFEDIGLSPGLASSVLAVGTLVSCVGRVGFGWLADRVDIRICMALMLAVQIVAMPFLILGGSHLTPIYIFACVWGMGYGGLATLLPAAAGAYFGRRHFGSIFGWITMGTVLGGAIGSTLGGWIHDVRGSYDLAWYGCIAMRVAACIAVYALAKKPRKG